MDGMAGQKTNARIEGFSTKRLSVSHWGASLKDAGALEILQSNLADLLVPEVLEHLPPSFVLAEEDDGAIAGWIKARDEEAQVYIVRNIAEQDMMGLLFLTGGIAAPDEGDRSADVASSASEDGTDASILRLGYMFAQSAWGKGYATELIEGLMGNLDQIGRPLVRAGVSTGNVASARVLIKSGFSLVEKLSEREMEIYEA